MSCVFCDVPAGQIIASNALAIATRDAFPINEGHTLVVTRRHVADWFEASQDEQHAVMDLVNQVKTQLDVQFHPDGYNVGLNVGKAAGQTVMHLHVHVIPRFAGDVDEPAGGVRFALPARGNYRRPGFVPTAKKS